MIPGAWRCVVPAERASGLLEGAPTEVGKTSRAWSEKKGHDNRKFALQHLRNTIQIKRSGTSVRKNSGK